MAFKNDQFMILKYFAPGGEGLGSSPTDPLPLVSGAVNVATLEAGMVVEEAAVVVTTAVVGITEINLGDDDDPDGFVSSGSITYATPGGYDGDGAYVTGGLHKYYAAAKTLKLTSVGAIATGAVVAVVKGYKV